MWEACKRKYQIAVNFMKKVEKDHINEYTAQCAYYTILAFIPFMILLITMVQYLPVPKETIYTIIKSVMPPNMNDLVLNIVEEIYSKSIATLSISIIFTLWSAGKGFYALCKGLYSAYETKKENLFIWSRIKATVYTCILISILLLALVVMVFGNVILLAIEERLPESISIFKNIFMFKDLALILVLFFILMIIYKFVPKHKLKLKKQIPGAIFASIGWYVISYAFSMYLTVFQGFSIMYGSLTTIILIMMWVYACMYCILLGAEVNQILAKKE